MLKTGIIICVVISVANAGMQAFDFTSKCYLNPCSYGGCIDGDQSYSCVCDAGFTDWSCCSDVDKCKYNLCVNGTCVDAVNGYSCVCDPGFDGPLCDQDLTSGYLQVEASSSDHGGRPEYALNGIKNGLHNTNPCHHSNGDSTPWWKVTLDKSYKIRRLVITNRLENLSHRFRDITIFVDDQVCATYPGPAPQNKLTLEITCERNDLVGQTVKIAKDGRTLTLCEVEMYMY